jgi:universal stress protein A
MADYKKILVLLDLTDSSEQIVAAARDMAAHSNAAMVMLHVVEFVPAEPMGETLMPTVQIEEDLEARAKMKLDALSARLGPARVTSRVEAGNKKTEILRVAKKRPSI